MENKKRKSTGLLLSILGVISLVLITAGVTYAFFSYAKQGEKENTITTGSITFIYNETGNALTINDALPKSDTIGMGENASSNFTFEVTSTTPSTAYINYIVTAKKSNSSTLPENQVKLYLTTAAGSSEDGTTGVTPATTMGSTAGSILTYSALPAATSALYPTIFPTTATQHADEKVLYVGQVPASSADKYDNHADYAKTFKLNMWLVGGEEKCFVNGTVNTSITTENACVAPDPNTDNDTYEWKADTTGMADYSAFEFVKVSSITADSATEYKVVDAKSDANATDELVKGTDILTSVAYYTALEAAADRAAFAAQYTRLAAVNQTAGKVFTVAQVAASHAAPVTTGWATSEQYYPFNGGTFTITINVYAEGATNYQAGN